MTVVPAVRAPSITLFVFASMSVLAMTSLTASCSMPPCDVKSFWYSINTRAVVFESIGIAHSSVDVAEPDCTPPKGSY